MTRTRLRIGLAAMQHPATRPAALPGLFRGRAGIDSIGLTEAYKPGVRAWLAARPYWRLSVDHGATDTRRGGLDNPIATRRRYPNLGRLSLQVSQAVEPAKYAPERWLHVSLFEHPAAGRVAHLNMHPNATAWRSSVRTPIRREYDHSLAGLSMMLRLLRDSGFSTVVTGDLNWPGHKLGGPTSLFASLGMHTWVEGLCWIAWHPRQLRISHRETIPARRTGGDHAWQVATFVKAPHS